MADRIGVVVLGSTGSIGAQTLDVVAAHSDRFFVAGLAANSSRELLGAQARLWPEAKTSLFVESGMPGLVELARLPKADVVVVAVSGMIGLEPTLAAIEAGKRLALASKEVLVAAGEFVMARVAACGAEVVPVDSEHSAVFQCVQGSAPGAVESVTLTASGGPFRGWSRRQLAEVSVEQALAHPTWRMGGKITVDSATLMNKALETIEARWLFDLPMERIHAVVHPQSIVHSFVRFVDGSVLGQLGRPNMRLPILYALSFPERLANDFAPWSPLDSPSLTFEPIDEDVFPALALGREAMGVGGTMPAIFNAANEVAANAFLAGDVAFLRITEIVARTMETTPARDPTLEAVFESDREARERAASLIASGVR